jgi:hypothetical protein
MTRGGIDETLPGLLKDHVSAPESWVVRAVPDDTKLTPATSFGYSAVVDHAGPTSSRPELL